MTPSATLLAVTGAAGLVLGSYAVTAALRYSRGEGSVTGGSRCDACNRSLGLTQTIPIVSFVGLRGVCSGCGARIDATHLFGELAGGAVVVGAVVVADPPRAALLSLLGLTLLASSTIDVRIRRLPDQLTLVVAVAGLALAWRGEWTSLVPGLTAAAVTAVALFGLLAARRQRDDPGLGLGDVKLLIALALWLGPATPIAVIAACMLGLLLAPRLRDEAGRLPFGPMIALSAWTVGMVVEGGGFPWTP